MSMSEYWDVATTGLKIFENNPAEHDLEQFRLKLMNLADKVESGEYSKLHLTFTACNTDTQAVTVGEVIKTRNEQDEDVSFWTEVQAVVPDTEKFVDTWLSFTEDIGLSFSEGPEEESDIHSTIIYLGDNRSEGDTTRFVEKQI